MRKFSLLLLLAALCVPATAEAKSLQQTYTDLRVAVVKKHGKRAPGRNIRKHGLRTPSGRVIPAQPRHFAKSIRQLRAILHPPHMLRVTKIGPPGQPPAGVQTPRMAPTGLAACIVHHESRGNSQAVNGQYHGIAQWSAEAWARHGGHKYASDPLGATYDEQLEILSNGLARYGCRDWCPFDGCG
jgi:hypothetical protein